MPAPMICFLVSAGLLAASLPGLPGLPADPSPSARIEVEFLADGRCTVSAIGEGFHSNLTYMPQARVSPTSELRCAIPPVPSGAAVDLTVRLPRGAAPSPGSGDPPLSWTRRDFRWIGTASLTAAPLLVRVPESGTFAADRARVQRLGTIGVCAIAAFAIAGWLWSRDRRAER